MSISGILCLIILVFRSIRIGVTRNNWMQQKVNILVLMVPFQAKVQSCLEPGQTHLNGQNTVFNKRSQPWHRNDHDHHAESVLVESC